MGEAPKGGCLPPAPPPQARGSHSSNSPPASSAHGAQAPAAPPGLQPLHKCFCSRHPGNLETHLGTKGLEEENITWAVTPLAATHWGCWLIFGVAQLLRAPPALLTEADGLRLPQMLTDLVVRGEKQQQQLGLGFPPPNPSPNTVQALRTACDT